LSKRVAAVLVYVTANSDFESGAGINSFCFNLIDDDRHLELAVGVGQLMRQQMNVAVTTMGATLGPTINH